MTVELPIFSELSPQFLKAPPALWVPDGLKDFQVGWHINLIRAAMRSELLGYLVLCEKGCSGCSACLWRLAGAHHQDNFKGKSDLVLARWVPGQIAARRVLYFPPLIECLNEQRAAKRSKKSMFSESSTTVHKKGGGILSFSSQVPLDFDLDSKDQNKKHTTCNTGSLTIMENQQNVSADAHHAEDFDAITAAKRIVTNLGLPDSFSAAAIAAVEAERKQAEAERRPVTVDSVVWRITDAANHAERRHVSREEFLEDFSAQKSARRILESVNLPITNNVVSRVAASVKAEAKDTGLSIEETTVRIIEAASEDRNRGSRIDVFYFENVKWRSNVSVSKAEQRKLNNLEVNARAKQRLRERFGAS